MNLQSFTRPSGSSSPALILLALAFAGLCSSFMQTILVPIQGDLPQLLGAPREATAWAITVTQVASAVCLPVAGRLGDMYGRRRVVLILLITMAAGSLLAAFSTNILMLIIARALQGIGFGVVVTGISLLRDVVPPERLATSIATVSATLGVGGAIGMPISAAVADNFDWRVLFWMATGMSLLALAGVWFLVPNRGVRTGGRIDWWGMAGLAVIITALLLLITYVRTWPLAQTLAVGFVALAVLAVWVIWELRAAEPLVDLRANGRAPILLTHATGLLMGFALFAPQVAFPQILSLGAAFGGIGLGIVPASFAIMPLGLSMLAMSPVAGRLEKRWGAKALVCIGASLMALGYTVLAFAEPSVWLLVGAGVIIGCGTGLGYASMPALVMSLVPSAASGAANGLNALARSMGTALASTIVASMLAASVVQIGDVTAPTVAAFDSVFLVAMIIAAACAAVAACIPRVGRLS